MKTLSIQTGTVVPMICQSVASFVIIRLRLGLLLACALFLVQAAGAQSCSSGPGVKVTYRVAWGKLSKCGYTAFVQTNAPRVHVYHERDTHYTYNYHYNHTGTNGFDWEADYLTETATAGYYSYDTLIDNNVTQKEAQLGASCIYSNFYSGYLDTKYANTDTRNWWGINTASSCPEWSWSNMNDHEQFLSHNPFFTNDNGVVKWYFTYDQSWLTTYDSKSASCAGCTGCVDTNTISESDPAGFQYDWPVTYQIATERDYVLTNGANYTNNSAAAGDEMASTTGSTIILLNNEYTDQELYTNIMQQLSPFGDWNDGSDFWSSVAYSAISASHLDGSPWTDWHSGGDAELQELQYQMTVTDPFVMGKEFKVSWDVLTYDIWQGIINTQHYSTNILGEFSGASTAVYTVMPPDWDQSDYGGYVFGFVANVHVTEITQSAANTVGTGPGWITSSSANGCSTCGGGGARATAGSGGGIYASFSLGHATADYSAGQLEIQSAATAATLATPAALAIDAGNPNVEVIRANGQLRQVNAPQALADIVTNSPYSYQINYYLPSQVGPLTGGVHQLSGVPFLTWTVVNPDGSNDISRLQFIQTNGNQVSQWECDYNTNNGAWLYEYPGGLREDQIDTETGVNSQGKTTTITTTTRVPGGPDQYKVKRVYEMFGVADTNGPSYSGVPKGPYLIEETLDPDNDPKTTTYTYNLDAYANGTSIPLESILRPDGSWEVYSEYDTHGRPHVLYSSENNTPLSEWATGFRNTTSIMYDPSTVAGSGDDGSVSPNTPRRISTTVNGVETLKFTAFPSPYQRLDISCPRALVSWDDPGNLVTRTTYYPDGPNTNRVQSVLHPDGTMQIYTYDQASDGSETNTIFSGVPDSTGTNIVDGTETITVTGPVRQLVSRTQIDIASQITTSREIYGNYDQFSRPQLITYLDGTSNVTVYSCCGLDTSIDRDGVATYYEYDAAKRLAATTRLGITTSYTLDSLGHVLKTTRTGTDNSAVTLSQSGYDLAGKLVAETNALGGVTRYSEGNNSWGGLERTTVYPDGGTRIEEYNLDESLASIIGTAVHGKAYGYGGEGVPYLYLDCSYTAETNLDNDGNLTGEWSKTYADPLGRTVETLYPGDSYYNYTLQRNFGGPSSILIYNSVGQLTNQIDPDGVSTLYQYNAKGEVAYTVTDMPGLDGVQNGQIDFDGSDRITWTTNDVIMDHAVAVNRTRTYVWLDGQSTPTLASVSETSVDGLKSWQTTYGEAGLGKPQTSSTVTSYSGNSRSVVSTAPDGSYTISIYVNGQLQSSSRYDANNNQIGGTTYTYDAHGRQWKVTDARNGSTTYGYNAADQVATVTTPAPGNGGAAQTTTTLYDNMLRPYSVIQPDGTSVNSVYLLTGELALQYGSRTYPVGYGYDYAGRMQTMTNWSSFSSQTGVRVTTWLYDGQRGWLTNKVYADGHGPSYTHTPGGRLQSRIWVRQASGNPITTSYNYDAAGSVTNIAYSDSTPSVTNSYDRLGRLYQQSMPDYQLTTAYNLGGQPLAESWTGGPLDGVSVTNGYDQFLRRTNLTINNQLTTINSTAYGYDAASRLSAVNDGNGDTATYSYLANSPLVQQIAFKQNGATRMTTTKSYDYLNRLTTINSSSSSSSSSFSYQYNLANQRTKDTLADGSYWAYQYDSLGQVIGGHKYFYDHTPVPGQQFDYGFDDIGNRMQTKAGGDHIGGNQRVANYTVNNLNQITQRDYPGTNDVVGVALATNGVTVNGQTAWRKGEYFWGLAKTNNAGAPQWVGVTVASGGNTNTGNLYFPQTPEQFSYDADGNLTNDGRWSYVWDAENRLVQMTVNTNIGPQYQLTFAYDANGRRIQKLVSLWNASTLNYQASTTNSFVYDGWNLIADFCSPTSVLRTYTWGSDLSGSEHGLGGVGGLLAVGYHRGATTNCFLAFDGNGNVVALVNAGDGIPVANYECGPFGEVIRQTGPMAGVNLARFSTKYQDDESELLYFGNRYYKPFTGSWLNRDSIEESGGLNVYALCGNDPLSFIDPVGFDGASIVLNAFKNIRSSFANSTAASSTGYKKTLSRLAHVLPRINVKYGKTPNNAAGIYYSRSKTIILSQNAGDYTILHEMVHAWNDNQPLGLTDPRLDEGMAYVVQYGVELAVFDLAVKEDILRAKAHLCDKAWLTDLWQGFWKKKAFPELYPEGAYEGLWRSHDFLLTASDFQNVQARLSFKISCDKIADAFNAILENKCCYKFTCNNDDSDPNHIPPGIPISPVFRSH